MSRAIVEYIAVGGGAGGGGHLYARCDDGTLWQLAYYTDGEFRWRRMPDIPQETPEDKR